MVSKDVPASPVKTTQRTLRIVELLKDLGGATIQEVAERLDMSKSSAHDYLKTLEHEGYVVRDGYTYCVGLKFMDLGGYARVQNDLYAEAKPVMKELAEETEELVSLLVEEHGRGCFISRSRGSKAVNLETYVGECIELHSTALGKAVLAHLPEERVDAIIERYGLEKRTENTVTDPDALSAELEHIREEGTAVGMEERIQGLCSIAVPIIPNGEILGSLSIAGPRRRLETDEIQAEHIDRLQNARNVIELNLQHTYS